MALLDVDSRFRSLEAQCVEATRRISQVATITQSLVEEQRLLLDRFEKVEARSPQNEQGQFNQNTGSDHHQAHQIRERLSQMEKEQRAAALNLGVILSGTGEFEKQQNKRWRELEDVLERRLRPIESWVQVERLGNKGRAADVSNEDLRSTVREMQEYLEAAPSVDQWLAMAERQSSHLEAFEELQQNFHMRSNMEPCAPNEIPWQLHAQAEKVDELQECITCVEQKLVSCSRDMERQLPEVMDRVDKLTDMLLEQAERFSKVDEVSIRLDHVHTRASTHEEKLQRFTARVENLPSRQDVRSMCREELQRKFDDASLPALKTIVEQHDHALEEVSSKLSCIGQAFSIDPVSPTLASPMVDLSQDAPFQQVIFTPPRSGLTSSTASMTQEMSAQRLLSSPPCSSSLYSSPVTPEVASRFRHGHQCDSLASSPGNVRSETITSLEDSKARLDDVDESMADVQMQLAKLTNDAELAICRAWTMPQGL